MKKNPVYLLLIIILSFGPCIKGQSLAEAQDYFNKGIHKLKINDFKGAFQPRTE